MEIPKDFHHQGIAEKTKIIQVQMLEYSQFDSILVLEISTLSFWFNKH